MDSALLELEKYPGRTVVVQGLPGDCAEVAPLLSGREVVLSPISPFHRPNLVEALHYEGAVVLALNPTCTIEADSVAVPEEGPGRAAEEGELPPWAELPGARSVPRVPVVTCFTGPQFSEGLRKAIEGLWDSADASLVVFSDLSGRVWQATRGAGGESPFWRALGGYVAAVQAAGEHSLHLMMCAGTDWRASPAGPRFEQVESGPGFSDAFPQIFAALPEEARVVLSSAFLRSRAAHVSFVFGSGVATSAGADASPGSVRYATLLADQLDAAVLRLFARNAAYARGRMGLILPPRREFSRIYLLLADTSPQTRALAASLRAFLLSPRSPLDDPKVSLLYLGPRPDEYKLGNLTDAGLFVYLTRCPACATPWLNPAFKRAARQPVPLLTAYELECALGLREFDFDYESLPELAFRGR